MTVHKSVVGNPATGYVVWEESKEYVLAGNTPVTVDAGKVPTNLVGNASPAGSAHTFDYPWYDSDAESTSENGVTPKKTVLPEDYDATSGNTPPGFEGTWRQTNARVSTVRELVPGHTSTPSKAPGPFYVDTPPASK